ncbi:hypothetical protein MTR_1g053175 [Medicago truncatula]|uniref:Uncharacterized protein n=1 Tax=Medicago truncatula TaxID=3880 RepID=A0A072VHY2_MEDTR|nr:hypothetical protein MTR_1g053175 [Medicago truncatula]
MKYIYWNIRGIGNLDTQIPAWYWHRLHLQNSVVNDNNKIWCLWSNQINTNILFNSAQCIALSYISNGSIIYTAAIYASTKYTTRRQLWMDL